MHSLAQRVLSHIWRQELLRPGDRVGIAVSGGIDSVALLRLMLELRQELGIVLSVVHFNHQLRGAESDADQEFVANLARAHDLEFYVDGDKVALRAAEEHISVETAARELRYGFFHYLLGAERDIETTGAEAPIHDESENRSAERAAPPKSQPQELKPDALSALDGAAGSRALSNPNSSWKNASQPIPLPLNSARLDKVVTGHTLDDQAETVLMRIIRGTGLRGVGGIHPRILVEDDDGEICGEIIRPLLAIRRRELEQYLKDIGQNWREDSSNTDERFTRNRLRKMVVPLLEREFNPALAEGLAELAEIARGEEDYWENEASGWLGTTVHWSEPDWAGSRSASEPSLVQISPHGALSAQDLPEQSPPAPFPRINSDLQARIESVPWKVVNASVSRIWFLGEPIAARRRVLKAIGEHAGLPLEFKHVEEILRFAEEDGPSGKELSLPLGWTLLRESEELRFVTPDLRVPSAIGDYKREYEYEMSLPGEIRVVEVGSTFALRRIPPSECAAYNSGQLLDAESVPGPFRVRNWRPGDRFWPAHTKSPKKIKELLQERHTELSQRKVWPVMLSGDEIVWLRGFPVPAKFAAKAGRDAILVVETPNAR